MFFDVIKEAIGERRDLGFVRPEHFDVSNSYHTCFFWKLDSDPERPNKPSRNLSITIEQNAVEDFHDASNDVKERALARLNEIIINRMRGFNPDHENPHGTEAPTENWVITTQDIIIY